MAYKFQRGGFTASGSITAEEGLSSQTTLSASSTLQVGGTATLAGVNATSVTVTGPVSGSGNFQVGGTLTVAASTTLRQGLIVTGSLTAIGNVTLGNGDTDLVIVSGSTGSDILLIKSDVDIAKFSKTNGFQVINGQISGSGNISGGGTLTVAGQGTFNNGIQVTAGNTTVQSLTASALSGSAFDGLTSNIIARWNDTAGIFDASYLTHDAPNTRTIFANTLSGSGNVQIGGTLAVAGTSTLAAVDAQALTATTISGSGALQVGSSATIANGLTVTAGGLTVSAGDSSVQKLTVNGDLIVLGTTFSASVQNLVIEDKQIVLADGATTAAAAAGAGFFVSGSNVEWTYKQNGEGSAASSGDIFVASGSSGLIDIQAANFYGTLVGTMAATVTGVGDADVTLVSGINYANATFSVTRTWTLPSAPSVGDSVRIKGASNLSPSVQLIVSRAGSHTIDGETTVALESPYAAIECVYVAANTWIIF